MTVLVATIGSRGDVQPALALSVALRGAGHDVVLATHARFRPWIEGRGIRCSPLPGDPREVIAGEDGRDLLTGGRGAVRFARRFVSVLEPWFEALVADLEPLVATADLVVYSPLAFPAWHLGRAFGIPTAMAALQPLARTRAFPAAITGGRHLGPAGNLATHLAVEQLFWQPLRRSVNRWRTAHLGLPPVPIAGPWRALRDDHEPQLYAMSPTLVPPPTDWGPSIHVTGRWTLPSANPTLDDRIESFLEAGPPPVYAGFGSMDDGAGDLLSAAVVAAARTTGFRLVLGSGWAGLDAAHHPDVLVVDDVSHELLFPRVTAAVHHGGAGTTHAALAAGVPSVIVPFFADQPFWGRRIAALGAGPAPLPRADVTPRRLARAVAAAVEAPVRERAAALGEAVRAEDGAAAAVAVLERIMDDRARTGGGRTSPG